MQNLKFIQLLILSNTTKSANQFKFSKNLNLITATDNSVGKSTLIKLLFWGLGCEPELDTTWKSQDCKTIVDFEIDTTKYRVRRYKSEISLKIVGLEYTNYTKITGDYSIKFAEILNFKALLPNQKTGLPETPPPAYYFLPFYIDQKRSWTKAWDNFENLGQYLKWKSTIIKYHVGLLLPEHFQIELEKANQKDSQKKIQVEVDKIDTALEIVETYIPQVLNTAVNIATIDKMTDSIKLDLVKLQETQEKLLNNMAIYSGERTYLNQQQILTEKLISELDKDYVFSVENIEDDEIECPLCGTVHDNTILSRASIMTDKSQAENQLIEIQNSVRKIENKIAKNEQELINARKQIDEINTKYVIEESESPKINFIQIIESIAGRSIKEDVTISKTNKLVDINKIEDDLKKLQKDQKELVTKDKIETVNNAFNSILSKYIKFLDAEAVNLSEINSPLDYNKVIKEGGAAEGTRAILAYYLTIFSMVEKYGNEIKTALVIDTPNQQEQSHTNYEKIINLLTNEFSDDKQIILSAMENEHLKPYMEKANVIALNKDRLLCKERYDNIKIQFD